MAEDLPKPLARARARVEAERAKAELWFNEAVKNEAVKKDKTRKAFDETLLRYIFRVFFVSAGELYNASLELDWPADKVRKRIEQELDSVIDEAFNSKHYDREMAMGLLLKPVFRTRTTDAIRSSDEWCEIQEKLKELAERQAENGTERTPSLIGRLPKVNGGNGKNPEPQFPKRASWLKDRLRERSWNKHDLSRHGGPDHKSAQKILDGFTVREDVLAKVADALSKKHGKVNVLDIPQY